MATDPRTWAALRTVFRPYRGLLALAFGCVLVGASAALAVPWLSGELVDAAAAPTSETGSLDRLAAVLLALFVLQAVAGGFRSWAVARAGQSSVRDLRRTLFRRVLSLPVAFFDRTHTGEVTSRLQSDSGAVYGSGAGTAPQAAFSVLTVIGGTVLLFSISPALGSLILVVVPVAAVLSVVSGRRTRRVSREYQDQLARTNAFSSDTVSGIRVVKAFGAEGEVAHRFDDLSQETVDLGMQRARIRSVWGSATTLLASSAIVAAVWLGGRQIQSGSLSAGELVAFIWYGLLVTRGIADLAGQYSRLQQLLGSADRVATLLAGPSPQPTAAGAGHRLVPPPGTPALELRDVSLTYEGRSTASLSGVSFSIATGESVALVGPSGAGKSSIARLFLDFYAPSGGRVLVAGTDVGDIAPPDLRRTVALVPQDAHLLSGTVADNLRLGWPGADLNDLRRAAATAHALEFIEALPRGFDTEIGERGVRLSGGQQQRLAIARARVADPAVLLLDEATSALDTAGEAVVRSAMAEARRGRTSLVIAHRLSTVRDCDRVIVLSRGRVVEEGTPDDLLGSGGLFAELAQLQR